MRIGLWVNGDGQIDEVVRGFWKAADLGFASAWTPQLFGHDALTVLALAGREVTGIELGTAVVPTYPRHPQALAMQALTTQAACDGRLTLGIGLSHKVVIENMYGYSYARPVDHMTEYLAVLQPLLHDKKSAHRGETLGFAGQLTITDVPAPDVVLAALAPRMLALAGEQTAGTVTWMAGLTAIDTHVTPLITKAADAAGNPRPRVIVALPVCVTNDEEGARAKAEETFAIYGQLPAYQAVLARGDATSPGQVAVVGDEDSVRKQIGLFREAGATEFVAAVYGGGYERERTMSLLADLARSPSF